MKVNRNYAKDQFHPVRMFLKLILVQILTMGRSFCDRLWPVAYSRNGMGVCVDFSVLVCYNSINGRLLECFLKISSKALLSAGFQKEAS